MNRKPKTWIKISDADRGAWMKFSCGCVVTRSSPLPIRRWSGYYQKIGVDYNGRPRLGKEYLDYVVVKPMSGCPGSVVGKRFTRKTPKYLDLRSEQNNCPVLRSRHGRRYIVLAEKTCTYVEDQLAASLAKFE